MKQDETTSTRHQFDRMRDITEQLQQGIWSLSVDLETACASFIQLVNQLEQVLAQHVACPCRFIDPASLAALEQAYVNKLADSCADPSVKLDRSLFSRILEAREEGSNGQ